MSRVGILGGTFNPVHNGHIELGLQVRRRFSLDRVLYMVSARPPHKNHRHIPAPEIRLEMLRRALRFHPELEPCDLEIRHPDLSWTITTLRLLREESPGDHFFFITGSEGFLKIRTWKEYREVLRLVPFIIVLRRPEHRAAVTALLQEEGIPWSESDDTRADPPRAFLSQYEAPNLTLSSTRIRLLSRQGKRTDGMVDEAVHAIMEEKRLYESK